MWPTLKHIQFFYFFIVIAPGRMHWNTGNISKQFRQLFQFTTSLHLSLEATDNSTNEYINFLLKDNIAPLIITVSNSLDFVGGESLYPQHPGEHMGFVIVSNMSTILKKMEFFIRPSGVFFFIIGDQVDVEMLEEMLRSIWMRWGSPYIYFASANVLLTFHPFIFDLKTRSHGRVVDFIDRGNIDALTEDMNGYPFVVEILRSVYSHAIFNGSAIDANIVGFTGADIEIANLLQKQMNFTFIRQPQDKYLFGYKLSNGSFTGAIGRILSRKTDAVVTGFFIKDYGADDIEFTVAVYSDSLCCYVPKAKRIPQSVLPLFSLNSKMWMAYIFTATACGGTWSIIRCFNIWLENHRQLEFASSWNLKQFLRIFTDTWVIWVRVGLRHLPQFVSERLFVLYICLVSVIFGAVFDSSLATVYIKPLYYKDLNTLDDLDKSSLKIYYKYTSMKDDLFPNETSALYDSLNRKMTYIDATDLPLIEIMAEKGGFAGVTRDSVLTLENMKYFKSNKIHKVAECPKTYSLGYVLPKHSVYSKRINTLLLHFLEAGLVDKWIEDMYFLAELNERHIQSETVTAKILTIKDLQLPFYVLLLGSILSGFVLILEKYRAKCIMNKFK